MDSLDSVESISSHKSSSGGAPVATPRGKVSNLNLHCLTTGIGSGPEHYVLLPDDYNYRSGTVNSKSFVGKVLLRIKRKFELNYTL